jgi:hypothetical protein
MLLQETGRDSPFIKDIATNIAMRERVAGLEALLKSDRVLSTALHDMLGDKFPTDPEELALREHELATELSLELLGADFMEFRLKGSDPKGMGKQLEIITSRFLEGLLVPEQNMPSAIQVLLDRRQEDLEAAERAYETFKHQVSNKMSASTISDVARLNELKQQLQKKSAELEAATTEVVAARKEVPDNIAVGNQLDDEVARLSAEIASLESGTTDRHSEVQEATRRLTPLLKLKEAEALRTSLQIDVEQLTRSAEALERSIIDYARIERRQQRLEQDVANARQAYDSYKNRYYITGTTEALSVLNAPERIKVIDTPKDPEFPVNSTSKYVIAGIAASIIMGVALVMLAEATDQRMRRPNEFTEFTGLPVIARLPKAI